MRRWARVHGPFETAQLRERYGLDLTPVLAGLERAGDLVRGELRPGGTQREWCDPEVLRRLRRASLAALRKEIEPADQRALARFLPALAGRRPPPARRRRHRPPARRARAAAGARAARRRVGEGRAPPPHRRLLAGLAGPAVRGGRGRLDRRRSARAALRPGRAVLPRGRRAARSSARGRGDAPRRPARTRRSASGCAPAPASSPTCSSTSAASPTEELQEALWDLVWAGEVTNDAFAPLRSPKLSAPWSQQARADRRRSFSARRRGSQPQVQGRWSLTEDLFRAEADPPQRRRTQAELLLERYGIVTREQVLAEGIPGGFSSLYDQLAALETLGVARRGYFIEGLGGAQFALPGAVERLRRSATTTRRPRSCSPRPTPRSPTGRAEAAKRETPLPGPPGGRLRRAVRRRARPLRRARRQGPAGPRRGGRRALGRPPSRRWSTPSSAAGSASSRSSASTASRSSARPTRSC